MEGPRATRAAARLRLAMMTSLLNMISGKNFKQFVFKKVGFIISKLIRLSNLYFDGIRPD